MRNRYVSKKHTHCKVNGIRKVRHKTLADAKAFRRLIHEEKDIEYSRIYRCSTCKGYHLTSKRQMNGMKPSTAWREPQGRRSKSILPYIQPMVEQLEIGQMIWNSSPSKMSQTSSK